MKVICTKANPIMLRWCREDAGRSVTDAAHKTKIDADEYKAMEAGEIAPTLRQLRNLADYYKRPVGIFFLPHPPKHAKKPNDYRAHKGILSPATLRSIRKARFVQKNIPLVLDKIEEPRMWKVEKSIVKNADAARQWLGLSDEDQTKNRNVSAFYQHLIQLLEHKGINLLQHSFPRDDAKAYSFPETPRMIVLTTNDPYMGSRIFSIFHELCHMSSGDSGLCLTNDSHNTRGIERECDRFAAEVLMPKRLVDPLLEDVSHDELLEDNSLRLMAEKLKCSMLALLIRLKEFGYVTNEELEAKKSEWRKRKKTNGFATVTRAQRTLKENGQPFTTAVIDAYKSNKITVSDASYMLSVNQGYLDQVGEKVGAS